MLNKVQAYLINCDSCGCQSPGLWYTEYRAIRAAQQIGWLTDNDTHTCLDCVKTSPHTQESAGTRIGD